MSKSVFNVVLLSGSSHAVEADKFYPDADGRSVMFQRDGENIAQFYNVESAVKQPPVPGPPVPLPSGAPGLCATAVAELGVVDFSPSVSIGSINILGGDPQQIRATVEAVMADLRNTGPIR